MAASVASLEKWGKNLDGDVEFFQPRKCNEENMKMVTFVYEQLWSLLEVL
jgi:hypothetical protein